MYVPEPCIREKRAMTRGELFAANVVEDGWDDTFAIKDERFLFKRNLLPSGSILFQPCFKRTRFSLVTRRNQWHDVAP
jgi:hypothetical protein